MSEPVRPCSDHGVLAYMTCMVDEFWQWLDERKARRSRVRLQRGAELDATWVDYGGES